MRARKAPSTNIVDAQVTSILEIFNKNNVWEKLSLSGNENSVLSVHLGPQNSYDSTDSEARGIIGSGIDYLTPYSILKQLENNLEYDRGSLFTLRLIKLDSPAMEYKTIVTSLDEYLEFSVKGLELMADELQKRKAALDEKPSEQKGGNAQITLPSTATARDFRKAVQKQKSQDEKRLSDARLEKGKAFIDDIHLIRFYCKTLDETFWKPLEEARKNGQPVRNIDSAKEQKVPLTSGIAFIDGLVNQEKNDKNPNYDISDKVDLLLERITAAKARVEEISKIKATVVRSCEVDPKALGSNAR